MRRIFRRTSITVDEAVYMMLGQIDEPIEFTSEDESDMGETGDMWFCLREVLADEFEVLDGEYSLAKHENQPADVIAEKYSRLQQHEALIEQANAYLCAIDNEIKKGEQSTLRIDKALSNATYTYITLHSFNEWAKAFDKAILANLQATAGGTDAPTAVPDKKPADRTRMRQQETAILEEIVRQGCDPLALPPLAPGKPGVKAAVRNALRSNPLFKGKTTFKRAWDQLREDESLSEMEPPSSLQIDQ